MKNSPFYVRSRVFLGVFAAVLLGSSLSPFTLEASQDSNLADVKVLRQDRESKMPYLDKGYIRSEINPAKLRDKKAFLSTDQKTLNELIDRAIVTYTPARAARERISLARRRILVALRALFPEASFDMNEKDGDLSDREFNAFNYRFKFKQPIFRGGVLWNTLLQEKVGLEAAEKEYQAALEDVVNEVAGAYFEFNRAVQVLKDQENLEEEIQHYADISEKKFKEDIISEIERLNVQSLNNQVKYDRETSRQELELSKLELQRLLNLDIQDDFKINSVYNIEDLLKSKDLSDPNATEDSSLNLNHLVDKAYLNRPELRVEAAKLQASRLEERIRTGKLLPQADATLEFGKLGEAFDDIDLTPSLQREFRFMLEFNWNVGGNKIGYTRDFDQRAPTVSEFQGTGGTDVKRNTLSVGLLDGLKDYADAKEAEVLRLEQVTQLEKKEKEVIQEVKKSFFDYQKARIQVQSSLQRVDYRRRLVQLSKHKLEKNEIQISEYLQAMIDMLQEQTTLHKALADYYSAKARLNHAIGIRNFLPLEEVNERPAAKS